MAPQLANDETATLPTAPGSRKLWHVITCEYPPQLGGVSDYTRLVAERLGRSGEEVHIWRPRAGVSPEHEGVTVHDTLGSFGLTDLWRTGKELNRFRESPRNLLVQWVPHGYGFRSMNLPFCFWLWGRSAWRGDRIEIMVHEPYLSFREGSWRQGAVAVVHRLMTVMLLRAASKVWVSIPAWESHWRPYALGRRIPFAWLPLPSTVPVVADLGDTQAIHNRYCLPGGKLIGHFGTFGSPIIEILADLVPTLLHKYAELSIILIGPRSPAFRETLLRDHPGLAARMHALGPLSATDPQLSRYLSACDLMIQPYPDGISTRRTSAMASLSHGVTIVTTKGRFTEDVWIESGAVAIVPFDNKNAFVEVTGRLLENDADRARVRERAKTLYDQTFDIRHVICALRAETATE